MDFTCYTCGKGFVRQSKEKKTINTFCSRSCAAKHNNKLYIKRPKKNNQDTICQCGRNKDSRANLCHKCKVRKTLDAALSLTVKRATSKGNARVKYAYIRKIAAKVLELSSRPKECCICGFDAVVEVCHITPISAFKLSALLSEVNAETNLSYLCPNHHAMLDKQLLGLVFEDCPKRYTQSASENTNR